MQDVVQAVGRYPMEAVIARYAKDEGLSAEIAAEHERELKRFLSLICLNPGEPYGMKGQIDKLWHTFIIHTRDYKDFCDKVAGRFIHHVPESPGNDKSDGRKQYTRLLEDYAKVFGEEPPAHVWPRMVASRDDESCSSCNGCGGSGPSCGANQAVDCSGCGQCSSPQ